jgi:hypothetical protein
MFKQVFKAYLISSDVTRVAAGVLYTVYNSKTNGLNEFFVRIY